MKITIIGPGGSGKSTLAKRIADAFTVPRLELDRLWFHHGGHEVMYGTAEEKALVQEKIKADVEVFLDQHAAWVCDGTYSKIQPIIAELADTVVLIQRPLLRRVMSHVLRVLKNDGRHPEVTWRQDLLFTKTIIRRWWQGENKKMTLVTAPYQDKLVVIKSFRNIDRFFASLKLPYEKN